jgi:hypothetical protein
MTKETKGGGVFEWGWTECWRESGAKRNPSVPWLSISCIDIWTGFNDQVPYWLRDDSTFFFVSKVHEVRQSPKKNRNALSRRWRRLPKGKEMLASCFSAVWLNSARETGKPRSTWDALAREFDGPAAHVSVQWALPEICLESQDHLVANLSQSVNSLFLSRFFLKF